MKNRVSSILLASFVLAGCQTTLDPQSKPKSLAVDYNTGWEMPEKARPNDATLSLTGPTKKTILSFKSLE